jgi:hypothetical protein
MEDLSLKEQACNYETTKHIRLVQRLLNKVAVNLIHRGEKHDESKLHSPEVELFTQLTPKLAGVTYNSDEYKNFLQELKPALDHHYSRNSHHPEFHKNGINDMTLVDLIEMFCDWKAATMRHNDGNLNKSIEINAKRYGISDQLCKIFENTVDFIEEGL